jgi:O-antigen/teichoic acid export membrane protein
MLFSLSSVFLGGRQIKKATQLKFELDRLLSEIKNISGLASNIFRAAPYFLTTVCSTLILTADKYLVKIFGSEGDLAVYILCFAVCFGLQNIADPAVISIYYPKIIKAHEDGRRKAMDGLIKKMLVGASAIAFGCFFLALAGLSVYLHFGKSLPWAVFIQILIPVSLASIFYTANTTVHILLYSAARHQEIGFSLVISLLSTCSVVGCILLTGVPAIIAGYTLVLIFLFFQTISKSYFLIRS